MFGDETGGVVIDLGNHSDRFGLSGDDRPRRDLSHPDSLAAFLDRGRHAATERDAPGLESVEEAALVKRINAGMYQMNVRAEDHPVILSVPTLAAEGEEASARYHERLMEILFEKMRTPTLFLCRAAVLSAFACGKTSCLVVDAGATHTTCAAVVEGFTLLTSARTSRRLHGNAVTARLRTKFPLPAHQQKLSASTVEDVKHSLCRAWRLPPYERELAEELDPVSYDLPDGTSIVLGPERFEAVEEALFPSGAATTTTTNVVNTSLSALVYDVVASLQPDLRREMLGDTVCVGGGSLLDGLPERLGKDLADRLPVSFRTRVTSPNTTAETKFSSFIGASVLSSLGSFQQKWVSAKEYGELGGAKCERLKFIH